MVEDAPIALVLDLPGGVIQDFSKLPECAGVVVFEGADTKAILIAASANVRSLVRRKLVASEGAATGRTVDLSGIVARLVVYQVESALEADAVYLKQARERLPHAHRVVVERWRAWFVHVDPDAEHPHWSKTNLMGLVAPRSASTGTSGGKSGVYIGPIPDKDSAGRLVELAIDGFDLCRYHNVLAQAPRGTPCAYKEMARCPSPCDGTESLGEYRARTREAVQGLVESTREAVRDTLTKRLGAARAAEDMALAGRCARSLTRLDELGTRTFSHLHSLDSWKLVFLTPLRDSSAARQVRLIAFAGGRLYEVCDISPDAAKVGALDLAERLAKWASVPINPLNADIDTIALVTRHVCAPVKKRLAMLRWEEACDPALLYRAIQKAARKDGASIMPEDRELESA